MIINSDFKDYYDYVAHKYRDKKVVYERKESNYDHKKEGDTEFGKFVEKYAWGSMTRRIGDSSNDREGECNLLLLGGKVYPFTNVKHAKTNERQWDFKKPYAYIDGKKRDKTRYCDHWHNRERLVSGECSDLVMGFNQSIAPVIIIWGAYEWHVHLKSLRSRVDLNPPIEYLHAPLSTWEIVQDIMGVIGSVDPHIPEMNNQNKIDSHGYDKYSFRPKMKR
jgi:hypothetical protein